MPPRSNKSRRQQTITYNLSNANARDAFEEELDLEDAETAHRHTAGRSNRTGRGSAAFSLAADMPLPLHQRDLSGMHEYASPQVTTDIINLLELFGASLDREVIESVYIGSNNKFDLAMERLLELAASSGANEGGAAGSGGPDQEGAAAEAAAAAAAPEAAAAEASAAGPVSDGVCYWDLLPDDLKRHVFAFLNSRDLARVARTCADFAGPARSLRTNTRQLQIPTGLGMHGIMAMVAGHPNARSVSLRQWASSPLSDSDFTALVVALSAGSRSERRAVPVEALSFKGCRWLSDGHVMALCNTMQHLKEVDLTDCVGITDAALLALSKYQRLAPEGSSSSDDDDDDAGGGGGAGAPAAVAAATPQPVGQQPGAAGLGGQRSSGGGGGGEAADGDGGDGDDELQFDFDVTPAPAPPRRRRQETAARGDDGADALGVLAKAGACGDDEEEEDEGQDGGGGGGNSSSSDEEEEEGEEEVTAMSPSPSNALHGAFAAGLALSPATGHASPKAQGAGSGGGAAAAAAGTQPGEPAGADDAGRVRRVTHGSDSASATPLYGTSPVAGGSMGTSYGAARGGATSPWPYGTSPAGGAGAGASASGTKSWLYGTSPVMGASPYFRTGGAASISHNGWLARAATAATKKDSGRGLMSINLSGCSAISSDGVKALLAAPLTKACLLQLDISRCPRITRAALILPATSNLCVLRASACHNLHEVIMQLPLTSPLTELHLADCKALSKLHVVAPALQQLHVGSCRHLTRLHLRCPQLRHLTASLCFRLVDLDPERWEVGRLEHLNLFGCRHLEWPGLAALLTRCGPSLRHLDINGCNAIVVADIPAGNDALRHLDASGCKSLVALRCPSPPLAALALRSCPRLQEVTLESAALEKLDISNCPHLQRLSMPALHQQQQQMLQQQQQGQLQGLQAAGAQAAAAAGGRLGGQVGALRAAVSGAAPAGPEDGAGAAAGRGVSGGGSSGHGGGAASGVMVRMAGCERLPVEIAVVLRWLREKAKQQAAAAGAGATPAAAAAAGRPGAAQGGDAVRPRA